MEPIQLTVDAADLDNAVFGVAQEIADATPGLTVRAKMRLTLDISDKIMLAVHSITDSGKRSAAGKKAAETRYNKPKPGPAVPAPEPVAQPKVDTAADLARMGKIDPVPQTVVVPTKPAAPAQTAPVAGNFLQQPDLAPPPHPALLPAGGTPFGAPPQ